MQRVRFFLTLIIARMIYLMIKMLNKSSGTSFVGMQALKLCPDFLKHCKNYFDKSIAITGTNGKTTTSGLIAHILDKHSVIHNVKGANMLTGIANIFALNITPSKKFDFAVLESDEAYLTKLYDNFSTDYLVVTNLFRDQLDRYGELETTANYIKNAINKGHPKLILNADDPLVANLGAGCNTVYYGIEDVEYFSDIHQAKSCAPEEMFNCPCGNNLVFKKRFFAHQGHYHCTNCDFKRPEPDYSAKVKVYKNYSIIILTKKNSPTEYEFRINLSGLYNVYNALAAIVQAFVIGIDYKTIKSSVESYKSIFGRTETRVINGHDVVIQLIKNPTGASEVLKTVDLNSHIIISINDNYADGRDISWLWDSDFELLKNTKFPIITTGIRAKDMAVRLKYAQIPTDKIIIEEDIKSAIDLCVNSCNESENITILPSYTSLLKINKLKLGKEK